MEDLQLSAEKIASFMRLLTSAGRFRLKFRITAGAGAADPDGFERRDIYVECKGPDADLLTDRDGELLRALEHVSANILALEPGEHDRISFDVNGYKAERAQGLREAAEDAIDDVKETGEPFPFPALNSRERRMLHMFLVDSGLRTASSGEGPRRHVVLYPAGYEIPEERPSFGRGRNDRGPRRDGGGNRGGGNHSGGRGRY